MKNQYVGDQNDYVKFGLLRALCDGGLRPFVNWMLTPDDSRSDGRRLDYLKNEKWRSHDPVLYDVLGRLVASKSRTVAALERSLPLHGAGYFDKIVPDAAAKRGAWSREHLAASVRFDLVFFDPDNGFEVKGTPIGRRNSSKYVSWDEVAASYKTGQSVLVYQHYRRVPRKRLAADLLAEMKRRTGCAEAVAFHTAHVLFVLGATAHHRQALRRGLDRVKAAWSGQIAVQLGTGASGK